MGFADKRRKKERDKTGKLKRLARRRVAEMRLEARNGHGLYGPGPQSKLNAKVAQGICRELALGNTNELAARMNGVTPVTMWQWIRAGEIEPDGPYGQFARDVAYAQDLAHKGMVKKLLDHDDWRATSFIMKNRWPKHYRDHIVQEMTGPDGGPISMNTQNFNVVLELHPKEVNGEQRESSESTEPKFRIDGAAADLPDLEESAGAGGS